MPDFQHGLFGCFGNCTICIVTTFVPCYTAGKIGEKVGDSCLVCCVLSLIPVVDCFAFASLRGKVREQKGIDGGFIGDLMVSWCCPVCLLCQAAQEVSAFGSGMVRE